MNTEYGYQHITGLKRHKGKEYSTSQPLTFHLKSSCGSKREEIIAAVNKLVCCLSQQMLLVFCVSSQTHQKTIFLLSDFSHTNTDSTEDLKVLVCCCCWWWFFFSTNLYGKICRDFLSVCCKFFQEFWVYPLGP